MIDATTGRALTVIVTEATFVHPPVVTVYEITDVPADSPDTSPDEFIVATEVVALDHTPPAVMFESWVVDAAQSVVVPVIGGTTGSGLTVTVKVAVFEHPAKVTVYEIIEVPADTPVTRPVPSIVATPGVSLDHTPPAVSSASCVVDPSHTTDDPVIEATTGSGLTVIVTTAEFVQPPELIV